MSNCLNATKRLLISLKIKHTSKYLKDNILSHPDYPSLLSISDTLENYQIETLAVNIDTDKLNEMPMPSIVQVKINGQPLFFVLQKVLDNKVFYYDDKNKLIESSKEEFFKLWTGICLLMETTNNTKERNIEKKIFTKQIQNLLIGSITIMLLGWTSVNFLSSGIMASSTSIIYAIAYIILKVIGLTVGVFLLWFDVDQYNPTLQSFCTGGGKKINCNAVLNSKHAKLFNENLSLSLLSFAYFFGTFSYLIITGFSFTSLSVLGIFSFLTLPVVLLSVYYQALVIKQWCKFCIIIQATLLLEICISFFGNFYKPSISYENIPLLLALLLIPILTWKLLRPLLKQAKEINIHKRGLKKIKNNTNVLEGLLVKSRKIETPTEKLGISIGNQSAKYHVIKVCNPYCGPCAKAHPVLEGLVKAEKISLQILFTASSTENKTGKTVSHFLAIDAQGDKNKTQKALDDWYESEQKDYDTFSSKYPMNGELELQKNKIEAMSHWCKAENIIGTPTVFINGYELPKEYTINDLTEVLR